MTQQEPTVCGWATMADGSRRALTEVEATDILARAEAKQAKRAADMPDEKTALQVMHDAYTRLKELGWNDAMYCPKDGSSFDVIEAGSTGIFRCRYQGEWPDGHWIVSDERDSYVSRPILFRLDPEAAAAKAARMKEAAASATRRRASGISLIVPSQPT